MGAAGDFLYERGFSIKTKGERIVVSPASRLTDDLRQYVRAHRLELLAELAEKNKLECRNAWCVTCAGKPLCMMIGEPMTYSEALMIARWYWPDADVVQK